MACEQGAVEGLGVTPAFWRGKRVLLTGHTGFKGSWLSLWLQNLDASVAGYSLPPPTNPSLFELAHVAGGMSSVTGDVRDFDRLRRVLAEHRPEIVIHLAAQSLVRYSYANPVETYATNVMGTANLLEAVRQTGGVRVAIIVTSDKCYENREWHRGYREDDMLGGHDPYSSSKACAEIVTAAYRRSYFEKGGTLPAVASVRAGNVIGGGDWSTDRLVPDMMTAFISNRPAVIRNSHAIRPWQHVLEPLAGYLLLAERLWTGDGQYVGSWNFGPDEADACPVSRLADQLTAAWGNSVRWQQVGGEQPHEANYLRLDSSKARQQLGWLPKLHLATALEWVVEWYKAYGTGGDVKQLTQEQIARFQELA